MKINHFTFTTRDWNDVAMMTMIFAPWLYKLVCQAEREKGKHAIPGRTKVLLGLVDLDLEDIEVFLPPPAWDEIKDSIVKVDGPHMGGIR